VNAIGIREGDELLGAQLCNGQQHILLGSRAGKVIRFHEDEVRDMGRTASGVKGMNLEDEGGDCLIGMVCVNGHDPNMTILAVSEKGIGKRTDLEEYRTQSRGGKGIKTINITPKTGSLISIKAITDNDDLMIINQSGLTIRMNATALPNSGRNTQGVKLINLKESDAIADIALIKDARSMEEEQGSGEAGEETTNENDQQA
jgi:DNA gyrase subunit A